MTAEDAYYFLIPSLVPGAGNLHLIIKIPLCYEKNVVPSQVTLIFLRTLLSLCHDKPNHYIS